MRTTRAKILILSIFILAILGSSVALTYEYSELEIPKDSRQVFLGEGESKIVDIIVRNPSATRREMRLQTSGSTAQAMVPGSGNTHDFTLDRGSERAVAIRIEKKAGTSDGEVNITLENRDLDIGKTETIEVFHVQRAEEFRQRELPGLNTPFLILLLLSGTIYYSLQL